jgi:hypothetical protein
VALQQKTNLSIREVWDLPTGKAKGRGSRAEDGNPPCRCSIGSAGTGGRLRHLSRETVNRWHRLSYRRSNHGRSKNDRRNAMGLRRVGAIIRKRNTAGGLEGGSLRSGGA